MPVATAEAELYAEVVTLPRSHLQLKNILVLADLDRHSHITLSYALRVQKLRDSRIVCCHLLPPAEGVFVPEDPTRHMADLERRRTEVELTDFEVHTQLKHVPHTTLLEYGTFAEVVPRLVEEQEIDLVVVGCHRHGAFGKFILGSNAEEVFRISPVPVMIVGPELTFLSDRTGFKKVLLATHFDPPSMHAAQYALSLAMDDNGVVKLLHVVNDFADAEAQPAERLMQVRGKLKELVPENADLFCSPEMLIEYGNPADRIVEVAEREKADLIVMGVHRPRFLSAAVHAPHTVAFDVITRAPCPVLTLNQ